MPEAETEDVLRLQVLARGIGWWTFVRSPEYQEWLTAHPEVTAPLAKHESKRYVESQHPRDPGGVGGGQWIKKGTGGVNESAIFPRQPGSPVAATTPPATEEIELVEEPLPPPEDVIEVTGRTLKNGDKFWIRSGGVVQQFQVTADAAGLGRYMRVVRLSDGRPMLLKASYKLTVLKADFPAAAKRLARAAPMHVEGELAKAFSATPGKTNVVTKAANEASAELAAIGLTLPDDMIKIPLKTSNAQGYDGQFTWERSGASGASKGTMRIRTEASNERLNAEMPSTIHHEFGHYLDAMVLPEATRRIGYAEGVEPAPQNARAVTYASLDRAADGVGPVMDAIDASQAGQRLADMQARPSQYAVVMERPVAGRMQYPADRNHISYVNDSSEKFARAYEQYVATKAGKRSDRYAADKALPPDDYYLDPGQSHKGFYGWYWDEEDFKPIAKEFDGLFGRLGWSKS